LLIFDPTHQAALPSNHQQAILLFPATYSNLWHFSFLNPVAFVSPVKFSQNSKTEFLSMTGRDGKLSFFKLTTRSVTRNTIRPLDLGKWELTM
jgi:hypothetical protein